MAITINLARVTPRATEIDALIRSADPWSKASQALNHYVAESIHELLRFEVPSGAGFSEIGTPATIAAGVVWVPDFGSGDTVLRVTTIASGDASDPHEVATTIGSDTATTTHTSGSVTVESDATSIRISGGQFVTWAVAHEGRGQLLTVVVTMEEANAAAIDAAY